jgi:predicted RNA binding protein YcfA (HicA-like mRNA interferase family)
VASLPIISGQEARVVFQNNGWNFARQRGSHIILIKPGSIASLSIPDHKELAKGTLRSLIRSAEMSTDEFINLFKSC